MPIIDLGTHIIVGEEIKSHWIRVNADRIASGGTALELADGYSLADLTTDLAAGDAAVSGQENLDNGITIATGTRDNRRGLLRDRVMEFREIVPYRLKGTGYALSLPDTPHEDASEQRILKALHDMEDLWQRINADTTVPNFTPPLLLRGNYPVVTFQADLALLRTAYRQLTDADNAARLGRNKRDLLLKALRERYIQYRQAIAIEYGADHPFTKTLPEVTPPAGSTPPPVVLTGTWNAAFERAQFSWPASPHPNLDHYVMRMSPGNSYDAATAIVIGTIAPETTTMSTTTGLDDSGDVASYKVFVVLTTGNEAGSNTVTITRP